MLELVINRGIPGSGKSTFALEWVRKSPNRIIVSRDAIRFGMYGVYHGHPIVPKHVSLIQNSAIDTALSNGISVIVDDCNIDRWRVNGFREIGKKYDAKITINLIDTPIAVALERNRMRKDNGGRFVPENVIIDMHNNLKKELNA